MKGGSRCSRCRSGCAGVNGENDCFGMSMAIPAAEIVVTAEELPIMGSASERIGGAAVALIVADVLSEAGADTAVGITDHTSHAMGEVRAAPKGVALCIRGRSRSCVEVESRSSPGNRGTSRLAVCATHKKTASGWRP